MKPAHSAIFVALFALASGAIAPSNAADSSSQRTASGDGMAAFVSGGVGDDERQQMERMAPEYPLQLLFATKGSPNQFLADVSVQIKDQSGRTVIDTVSKGPFLLAKIPAGRYAISADSEGVVKRQTVQIAGARSQRVVFLW